MQTALVFQNTKFDITDHNSQPWLRSPQIAEALGYSRANRVADIYNRHAEEFTEHMTAVVKIPTAGGEQETRIFSLRGAHLIAMFARTANAAAFRRWVLDILDRETTPRPEGFDWPSEISQFPEQEAVALSPEVQLAINRRAWVLNGQANELLRDYLTKLVTYHCARGTPRQIDEGEAQNVLGRATLSMALAPAYYHALTLPMNALKLLESATQAQISSINQMIEAHQYAGGDITA